jgi:predicted DNA-binding transcriptional regulator YafY
VPRPTARVLALLELLQAGGTRTAAALAEQLEVDERTVRRYVEHLLELEVPVEAVRGRYGGYRIGSGYRMPPLMLTDDEAVAAVLGLAATARSGPSAATRTAAETASAKIRRSLPARLADRVPGLLEVRTTAEPPAASPSASTEALLTASSAARERRPVRIRHRRRDGSASDRTVLPWGVVEHEGRWYLVGPDSASGEVRTFRMDRIERVDVLDGRFAVPPDADPVRQVLASLASTPRDYSVRVLIRAPQDSIRRRLPGSVAILEPVPADEAGEEGWFRVALEAAHLDWVAGVLALLDAPFRIEQPEPLRAEVLALARRLSVRAADPA